ncbi:hypothetical protein B0I35DRAFT_439250 [Stachybotrys elegans]|uniref:Uncharacterized protein n=1 Tax=Stachybotrys elegans TaxID=80388 RepID=A0A8K0SPH7_9HYPO|nr:hypothetical protein B0I35DRAFT_439250 [Stachybotrys elegans]
MGSFQLPTFSQLLPLLICLAAILTAMRGGAAARAHARSPPWPLSAACYDDGMDMDLDLDGESEIVKHISTFVLPPKCALITAQLPAATGRHGLPFFAIAMLNQPPLACCSVIGLFVFLFADSVLHLPLLSTWGRHIINKHAIFGKGQSVPPRMPDQCPVLSASNLRTNYATSAPLPPCATT